jgi:hypothetical protein
MAPRRQLILNHDDEPGFVNVRVVFDDMVDSGGSVKVALGDLDRWLGWATWKYDGVQVRDNREGPAPVAQQFEPTRRYIAVPDEGNNWHVILGREAKLKTGRRAICGAPVQAKAQVYAASPEESNCYRCRKKAGRSVEGWGYIQDMGGRRYR